MFVRIRSYDNYLPANITLQRLEAEGIRAYLQDEHTVTIDPLLSNAIGGIKLMVHASQALRAETLVLDYEKQYILKGACPSCGSTDVENYSHEIKINSWFSALTRRINGNNPANRIEKTYHCNSCQHNFEDPGVH